MSNFSRIKIFSIVILMLSLTACVTAKPVETQSTVDDRPLLFFVSDNSAAPGAIGIYVDGLHMGDAHEYLNNKRGLAVLPGTHLIELRRNSATLLSEKIYIGSGTSKTLVVNTK